MKSSKIPYFLQDKPLFGLDIGSNSLKVMQVEEFQPNSKNDKRAPKIIGYGFTEFDRSAQDNGVLVKPEIIAKAARNLFENHLIGEITTKRVAIAIPAYRTFTRSLKLPKLKPSQIRQAVELEAEQYIQVPLDDLYLDYEIVNQTEDSTELFVVAVPKNIVDSYLDLAQMLGLETVLIEPTLESSARLFALDHQSDVPGFIFDFGSVSADISIYDKTILVTGTVQGGGINFTELIRDRLKVTLEEAALIKTRYGLGASKRQSEIIEALEPTLKQYVKEIHRMMRYYEERYGNKKPITQLVTLGGGANMPGLSEYMTNDMRIAVRHVDPWQYLNFKGLQPPSSADKPMYATVAGLSLAKPKQVFLP
jgi:type IV pilus assembly protein PilM